METPSSTLGTGKRLLEYYQKVDDSRIIFLFKGAMSQNTLIRIGDLVRLPPEEVGENNASKRLFAIMVEMAQNILFYSDEREVLPHSKSQVGIGIVLVVQLPEAYEIICGNRVTAEQKKSIEERCLHLSSLNAEGLRDHYNQVRREKVSHESKGAGLGLIDIARRSRKPLQCDFYPLENDRYYFSLAVQLERETEKTS